MECLVVNQNKIKIALSSAEISKYGIKIPFDEPLRITANKYWSILDDVSKKQISLAFSERLLVQSCFLDSGAEIFVTKLGKSYDANEKISAKAQSSFILASRCAVYPFYSIDELIDAVAHITDYEGQRSSLYYSDDEVYYLFCEERGVLGVCSYLYKLAEFSKPLPPMMNTYITEHAKRIVCNDAIDLLRNLFKRK